VAKDWKVQAHAASCDIRNCKKHILQMNIAIFVVPCAKTSNCFLSHFNEPLLQASNLQTGLKQKFEPGFVLQV